MKHRPIFVVDFDLTLTTSEKDFPRIGPENPYAISVLKKAKEAGYYVVLSTMREYGQGLQSALGWLTDRDFYPDAANDYPPGVREAWNNFVSRKVTGEIIVDDHNAMIPLKQNSDTGESFVDWEELKDYLYLKGIKGPFEMYSKEG